MSKKLLVAPSPHLHSDESTRRIMLDVLLALVPALCVSVIIFGLKVLCITSVAILSCLVFEYLLSRFVAEEKRSSCGDLSAVVTGLLLGFNLPATLPVWLVVMGAFVSIGVAKMSFGGIGKNPFNPALVGRVFLLIAYPVQMTSFPTIEGVADSFSGATPLAALKAGDGVTVADVNFQDMMLGHVSGSLGEVAALALIIGGLYLLWRKVISWHIPVAIFVSMVVVAMAFGLFSAGYSSYDALRFALFHLLAGGAILGAVYMATDYSTSPMTHKAMLIYGVGIGVITMAIRLWGAYPEGISFAILVMNSCVPLLNKYFKPKRFGVKK
ncbi:MAG: RnfABCDGE type electron transport complex subunit D [Rikenellaceae bacterium]